MTEKQLDPFQGFIYGAGQMFGSASGTVERGITAAGDALNDAHEFVKDGITAVGDRVNDVNNAVVTVFDNAQDTVGDAIDTGIETMQNFGEDVAEYWGGIPALAQEGFSAGHESAMDTFLGDKLSREPEPMALPVHEMADSDLALHTHIDQSYPTIA